MANLFPLIIVAAVAGFLLILKTNSALVLLALCAGSVLVEFASKNMAYVNGQIKGSLLPNKFTVTGTGLELIILLVPPIVTAILLKKSQGVGRWPIQIFPAVATGILGLYLVVPLLSSKLQDSVTSNHYWRLVEQNQIPLIFACIIIGLVLIIMDSRIPQKSRSHKN